YAMSSYRQLPEVFRRLHPRFKTPWLSLLVFAGGFSIVFMLPGNVDFISRMYAFGAMLSFTVAHAAVIQLRRRPPPIEEPYRVPIVSGPESHESVDLAARRAAERGATIVALRVIVVPLDQPIDADLHEQELEADRLLDEARATAELYGVRVVDRIVRHRSAGR